MGRFDFLYKMDLQHRAVAVYIYLSDRANRDGECWPAIPTIARELKLSQSTVRRALQDLRKAKLLETEQRYRAKGGKSGLFFRRQGTIALSRWQVPPVMVEGVENIPLGKGYSRKKRVKQISIPSPFFDYIRSSPRIMQLRWMPLLINIDEVV